MPLALLLFPARSADRKKGLLPFGRRRGIASGLLNAARLSSLLLGFAGSSSRSLGSFRGRSLCGFTCYRLAPDPLSFCDGEEETMAIPEKQRIRKRVGQFPAGTAGPTWPTATNCPNFLAGRGEIY